MRLIALLLLFTVLLPATAPVGARTLETAYDDVTVEGTPERVVTLYEGALDSALAVGVEPLGAVATRGGAGVARYIQDDAGDIPIVGTVVETNLEAVAALEPDLILASPRLPEEQHRLLSQLAPVVTPPGQEGFRAGFWRSEARVFARALGREDAMEDVIDDVDKRIGRLSQRLDRTVPDADRDALLARWMPQGPMVMHPELFATGILGKVGFEVQGGDLVKAGRPHSDLLSLENLGRLDHDWLFMATLNADGEDALAEARRNSGLGRLDVVKNERMIPVDGQLWTSASGPLAAQAVLDRVAAVLDGVARD